MQSSRRGSNGGRFAESDARMKHKQNLERSRQEPIFRTLARRLVCFVAIVAMALAVPIGRVLAQETGPTEYQLKAAFLFNFAKFVDWPPSSFAGPQAPFAVCILGVDPFGTAIDETLRGQSIGGRAVTIQRVREAAQLRSCQVAFISASEKDRLREILQSVRGAKVLLVGETAGFASTGGAIQFQLQDKHIRFFINPDAAERAGLCVSSKLLSLATIVHDSAGKGRGCNS
jgi:hypothetical protein